MTLGLPGPGLTTIDLAQRSTMIAQAALMPGDLLINPIPTYADTWCSSPDGSTVR